MYWLLRTSVYRNMGVIEGYAGNHAAELKAYLTAIATYEKMLAANPNELYARTSLADLRTNSAFLMREARTASGRVAAQSDGAANELNLAARALVQRDFPELRDYKLGLTLAQRANAAAGGKDYVFLETLAEAYWMNRDRENAVRSIEPALKLVGETLRVRGVFEKTLGSTGRESYRSALPHAAPAEPIKHPALPLTEHFRAV